MLLTGASAPNGCDGTAGGSAGYACASFQPIIVNASLSLGFAGNWANENCCKCYRFTWTSGAAVGKSMIIQVVNAGGVGVGK